MVENSPGDLWEDLGSLDEFEAMQVLTRLFNEYEALLNNDPQSKEARSFFQKLETAVSVTSDCNLNRR